MAEEVIGVPLVVGEGHGAQVERRGVAGAQLADRVHAEREARVPVASHVAAITDENRLDDAVKAGLVERGDLAGSRLILDRRATDGPDQRENQPDRHADATRQGQGFKRAFHTPQTPES